jgi:hypothetical protein
MQYTAATYNHEHQSLATAPQCHIDQYHQIMYHDPIINGLMAPTITAGSHEHRHIIDKLVDDDELAVLLADPQYPHDSVPIQYYLIQRHNIVDDQLFIADDNIHELTVADRGLIAAATIGGNMIDQIVMSTDWPCIVDLIIRIHHDQNNLIMLRYNFSL